LDYYTTTGSSPAKATHSVRTHLLVINCWQRRKDTAWLRCFSRRKLWEAQTLSQRSAPSPLGPGPAMNFADPGPLPSSRLVWSSLDARWQTGREGGFFGRARFTDFPGTRTSLPSSFLFYPVIFYLRFLLTNSVYLMVPRTARGKRLVKIIKNFIHRFN